MKIDASSLLSIDFDSGIEKLAGSQLQGSWQLPAELARLAIAAGASSVDFDLEPRHLSIVAPGARLDRRTIADFGSLLDRRLEAADRHRAMVDLEERGAFVLSAIASSPLRSMSLTQGGDDGLNLALTAAGELVVHLPPADAAEASSDIRISVDGLAMDAGRAAEWLRRAGRFSPVPISIDGARISHGFHKSLIEKRLELRSKKILPPAPALPAAVAISRYGSTPRLWLLRHGIIATHATVPGYPAFEAAVEMAALDPRPVGDEEAADSPGEKRTGHPTGEALREALGPYLESLIDASVCLMIKLGEHAGSREGTFPEKIRARVARLLLRSALKRRRLSEVSGVRIFPLFDAEGKRLVSIDLVGRLVRVEEGGACTLDAVSPKDGPERYIVAGRRVLAISGSERALLGELLSVVFSQPPARARQSLKQWLIAATARRLPRLRTLGPPVPDAALSPEERGFLSRLAGAGEGSFADAEFRAGGGKVRRDSDGKLLLPRDSDIVRVGVRAAESDPSWLYPAVVALSADGELPGSDLRRQWFARLERA